MPTVRSTAKDTRDHIEFMEWDWGKERLIRVVVTGFSDGKKKTAVGFFRREDLNRIKNAMTAVEGIP